MSTVTCGVVDGDGASIHYIESTPRDDPALPPVVFVPGMTDVADDYREIADHTGRRTIVVELRGHGRSRAGAGWALEHHARDVAAVIDATVEGPLHLMTFSRGTCSALAWCADNSDRVRSLSIGDYPAREIGLSADVMSTLLGSTWRGTPVSERLDAHAFAQVVAASRDRPLWHIVAALDVPIAVVRSTATAPMNDADWERYEGLTPGIRLVRFDDSPHDIFRPDRGRYPRLVADIAAAGDRLAASRTTDQEV